MGKPLLGWCWKIFFSADSFSIWSSLFSFVFVFVSRWIRQKTTWAMVYSKLVSFELRLQVGVVDKHMKNSSRTFVRISNRHVPSIVITYPQSHPECHTCFTIWGFNVKSLHVFTYTLLNSILNCGFCVVQLKVEFLCWVLRGVSTWYTGTKISCILVVPFPGRIQPISTSAVTDIFNNIYTELNTVNMLYS